MWYDRLERLAMEEHGEKIAAGVVLPVKVKQNFKPVKASDIYAMAAAVASLYGNGSGVLAEFPEIAFEMMNWDQELLKAKDSASSPDKAAVVSGEDNEGKFEEYIIRRRLHATHQDCRRYDCGTQSEFFLDVFDTPTTRNTKAGILSWRLRKGSLLQVAGFKMPHNKQN